jgi:hypothetical protein
MDLLKTERAVGMEPFMEPSGSDGRNNQSQALPDVLKAKEAVLDWLAH